MNEIEIFDGIVLRQNGEEIKFIFETWKDYGGRKIFYERRYRVGIVKEKGKSYDFMD